MRSHGCVTPWRRASVKGCSVSRARTQNRLALRCWCSPHLAPGAPLYRRGWRAAVVSVNAAKAAELTRQAEEIARASGLTLAVRSTQPGLYFRRQPGLGIEVDGASCQVLASDRTAGHASGFDLVIVDELGLLHERDRPLLSGLRTLEHVGARRPRASTSASTATGHSSRS